MAKKTNELKKFKIKGEAFYCFTTKVNNKGKYPSGKYEVGVSNPEMPDDMYEKYVKTLSLDDEVDVPAIKIANSKYQFPMFDMEANRLDKSVPISNGTKITLAVEEKYNADFDKTYLVCKGIQINEPIVEYNPFK